MRIAGPKSIVLLSLQIAKLLPLHYKTARTPKEIYYLKFCAVLVEHPAKVLMITYGTCCFVMGYKSFLSHTDQGEDGIHRPPFDLNILLASSLISDHIALVKLKCRT